MDTFNATPGPTGEGALDEILERLVRIERLLMAERLEQLEGREGTEGEEEDGSEGNAASAGMLKEALSSAAATIGGPFLESLTTATAPAASAGVLETFIDGLGFQHFRGSEFTPYWSRVRNGVKNSVPPKELWDNIVETLAVLDAFRAQLGKPVSLLSTYRSPQYNAAVGGASKSMHKAFRAVDFTCSSGRPKEWAALLKSFRGRQFQNPHTGKTFTFRGGVGIYVASNFVHLDTRGVDVDWSG
ncbi:MAG TPA: D-Ala-D-Ala carboxypeptidase family metallohydrolase [Longimicrobium sp.]|jgi:hypothetical protein